jgi:hypothetical protein
LTLPPVFDTAAKNGHKPPDTSNIRHDTGSQEKKVKLPVFPHPKSRISELIDSGEKMLREKNFPVDKYDDWKAECEVQLGQEIKLDSVLKTYSTHDLIARAKQIINLMRKKTAN